MAINDVLPLKDARRDATAKLKCFGARGQQRPNFDGLIYIRYAAPPYLVGISAIYLVPFGKVWLRPFAKPGDEVARMQNLRRVGKNSGPILSCFWGKVLEILGDVVDPLCFQTPLPDCLYHVSFKRYSPSKSSKTEQM